MVSTALQDILSVFSPSLFRGKTILVSGATSGIGLAIARGFAGLGGETIATGSSAAKIEREAADPANAGLRFAPFDIRDTAAARPKVFRAPPFRFPGGPRLSGVSARG